MRSIRVCESRCLPIARLVVLLSCKGAFGAPHRDYPALVAEHTSLKGHAAVPEQHPQNDPGNPDCVAVLAVDTTVLGAADAVAHPGRQHGLDPLYLPYPVGRAMPSTTSGSTESILLCPLERAESLMTNIGRDRNQEAPRPGRLRGGRATLRAYRVALQSG